MPSRAAKELRTLLLPAGLILAGTTLAAMWSDGLDRDLFRIARTIAGASFFLGTPLLASWSLGAEFQQRTLVLLLTQPVSRSRVWLEKWLALAFVAVLLTAIQVASLRVGPFEDGYSALRGLWIAAMLCSAPLWTLLARSTIGGLAFSIAAVAMLEIAASFIVHWVSDPGVPRQMFAQTPVLTVLRVVYCVATFALGWWLFLRLQVGSLEHGHGFMAPREASGTSMPFVRYHPRRLLRNLLITELRLHRPTWLVSVAFVACWLAGLAFVAIQRPADNVVETLFSILIALYFPVAVVLAGTLAISEDLTLGVHAWRLTLPLSGRMQWLVKLCGTAIVAAITVVAIPSAMIKLLTMVVSTHRSGLSAPFAQPDMLVVVTALVVLSFWAATLFGHTIRAATAVGLMLLAIALSVSVAGRAAQRLEVLDGVMTWAILRWHLPPHYFGASLGHALERVFWLGLPVAISVFALVQSLRTFGRVQLGRRAVAWHVAGLIGFSFVVLFVFAQYMAAAERQGQSAPVRELRAALQAALRVSPLADVPRPVAVQELHQTGLLSPAIRTWIDGTTMTAERSLHWRYGESIKVRIEFPGQQDYYLVVPVADRRPPSPR